ncbi:hypothetical protein [Rhodococcus sp. IEGM 1379]|uniref:hypothetical protein n=1 Tax=Rhodococcus sp. IEGM 1379 TaxID=3047086 RepID=UPI0024B6599A|nr:hypothetical protein [Rhodococcus sp. IEGM 1379]MDI9913714.1 hypothetical protein [Rhodococcus sp. IEGM 1379]
MPDPIADPRPVPTTSTSKARLKTAHCTISFLRLAETGFTGLAVMNRSSGSAGEILQTAGAGHRREVVNLGDVIEHDGAPKLLRGSDWEPVGRRRGIEGACRHFLQSVRDGTTLDAEDALITHEWCEDSA